MYLLATHIPIFTNGQCCKIDGGWFPDLLLAREYLASHFGEFVLAAPYLPMELAPAGSAEINANLGIRTVPSFRADVRTRDFRTASRRWIDTLAPLVRDALVVQAGVDSGLRPVQTTALRLARAAGKTSVLVGPDMDIELRHAGERRDRPGLKKRVLLRTEQLLFESAMRKETAQASVCMLKEGLVFDKYAGRANNPRSFCHTMHRDEDVIAADDLERRLAGRDPERPLRLVYFGRLVRRKGVADSLRVVAEAVRQGVSVTLDLFGEGPERGALGQLCRKLEISNLVRFRGHVDYGPGLLRDLRRFDALLFSPTQEDSPRMVYDAMACGLALITSDTPFLRMRAERDGASLLFPVGNTGVAASRIVELHRDTECLARLSRAARTAGLKHSVEHWYGRRVEWTIQAVEMNDGVPRPQTRQVNRTTPSTTATNRPKSLIADVAG